MVDRACRGTQAITPRGLPVGTHTAAGTITTDAPEVPESHSHLPLRFYVAEYVYRAYLPLMQRR